MVGALPSVEPGTVLVDRYRIERRIGEGGLGVVWEAVQLATERLVALKVLKAAERDPRFVREARIAAKLRHPNVVQVFDFYETGDLQFLVMERLHGETLADRIHRDGALTGEQAVPIFTAIASALVAAHDVGIIHRDLKVENVFLAKESDGSVTVKVLDFGIAKVIESDGSATAITHSGALLGTPRNMAPEQIYGERDVDARADLWALGVLGYHVLAGESPFDGDNYGQIFRAITQGSPRPLGATAPNAPEVLVRWVESLMQRDREARPRSAQDVKQLLHAPARGPKKPPARAWLLALLVVPAVTFWLWPRPPPEVARTEPERPVVSSIAPPTSGAPSAPEASAVPAPAAAEAASTSAITKPAATKKKPAKSADPLESRF